MKLGIALVPEGRRLFPDLTVEENLASSARAGSGRWNVEAVLDAFPLLQPLRTGGRRTSRAASSRRPRSAAR